MLVLSRKESERIRLGDSIVVTVVRVVFFGLGGPNGPLPLHLTETTLVSGHLMPPEIEDLNDYQIPHWPSTPEGEARLSLENQGLEVLVVQEFNDAVQAGVSEAISCCRVETSACSGSIWASTS